MRSTITVDYDLRYRFKKTKEKAREVFNKDLNDSQFLEILLNIFEKYSHIQILDELKQNLEIFYKIIEQFEELESLKRENKTLKEEIERLKKELDEVKSKPMENLTARQLFWKMIERVRSDLNGYPDKDKVVEKLAEIGLQLFSGDKIVPNAALNLRIGVI